MLFLTQYKMLLQPMIASCNKPLLIGQLQLVLDWTVLVLVTCK